MCIVMVESYPVKSFFQGVFSLLDICLAFGSVTSSRIGRQSTSPGDVSMAGNAKVCANHEDWPMGADQ